MVKEVLEELQESLKTYFPWFDFISTTHLIVSVLAPLYLHWLLSLLISLRGPCLPAHQITEIFLNLGEPDSA
jgi:hypothetical protein